MVDIVYVPTFPPASPYEAYLYLLVIPLLLRRAALFEQLRGSGAQVWMTGTELAPFSAIAGEAAVWRVSAGAVERD